jgi:hypothetical protein
LFQAQQLLGETPDPRDLIPNFALVERTIGGLARLVREMSVDQAENATAYFDRVFALAGVERMPLAALEEEANRRLGTAEGDARAAGLANLLLAAARFRGGDAKGAAGALERAEEADADGLHAYVHWGQSVVLLSQDRVAEAMDYALLALGYAEEGFGDLEPLARHTALLVEEAARRGLAAPVARGRDALERRLDAAKGSAWTGGLLERIRGSATVPSPQR